MVLSLLIPVVHVSHVCLSVYPFSLYHPFPSPLFFFFFVGGKKRHLVVCPVLLCSSPCTLLVANCSPARPGLACLATVSCMLPAGSLSPDIPFHFPIPLPSVFISGFKCFSGMKTQWLFGTGCVLPGLENHSEFVEVETCACSVNVGVVHVVARWGPLPLPRFILCWCTLWARILHDLLAILSELVATQSQERRFIECQMEATEILYGYCVNLVQSHFGCGLG